MRRFDSMVPALAYGGPPQGYPPPPPPGGGYGPPPGYQPPQGFGPPGGGFPPPGGPMMPGSGGDVNTTLPLVLSIVSLLLGINPIGIVALVFAILAMNARTVGNLEDARSKAKISIILACVAIGFFVLAIVLWLVIVAGIFGAAMLSH